MNDSHGREHADPLAQHLPPLVLDRQRVIRCAAFRRLQYKTQVFVATDQDHFRTRLTHTLEVAHLARLIASRLNSTSGQIPAEPEFGPGRANLGLRLDPDLAEVVALAHDLGHPPFGHAGEAALAGCLAQHGGFEHNAHTLRVVEYLEHPYPDYRGLNLTRAVRECLAKHSTRYDRPAWHPLQDGSPAPLEGQAVDLADRLAYALHDLHDAAFGGFIDLENLSEIELWAEAYAGPPGGSSKAWLGHVGPTIERIQHQLLTAIRAIPRRDEVPGGAHGAPGGGEEGSRGEGEASGPFANRASEGDAPTEPFAKRAPEGDAPAGPLTLALSRPVADQLDRLETLLANRVYRHPKVARLDRRAGGIVKAVFEAYIADPDLLPPRYRARVADQGLHRVVADYVAGMTDRFCLREHRRLFEPAPD